MNNKISLATKLAYGSGSFGNNLVFGIMTIYLMVFYTDYFGLAPAAVGTLFLVARIWDAVNDPIVGVLVDNTRTRWGRFRPYLLFVPVPMAILTVLCFASPDLSPTGKLLYVYITYILWGMAFTAMDIPYWAMSATLTEDPKERNSVVMIPRTLGTLAWALIGIITLPLVDFLGQGDERQGFLYTAIFIGVVAVALTWITFGFCRERVNVERRQRHTFKHMVEMVWVNRPLRIIIGGMLLIEIIYNIRNVFPVYYLIYVLDARGLIPLFMGVNLVISVVGCLVSPLFSNRFGKKSVAIAGFLIASVAGVLFYFAGYESVIPIFLFNGVALFTTSVANIALMSMLLDTVEFGEWKTGRRSEGLIFAANTFRAKVSGAIGGAIGAYALAFINYVPNVDQTEQTIHGMHLFFTLVPAALSLLALAPFFFYELTEARYREIMDELLKRRAGRQSNED